MMIRDDTFKRLLDSKQAKKTLNYSNILSILKIAVPEIDLSSRKRMEIEALYYALINQKVKDDVVKNSIAKLVSKMDYTNSTGGHGKYPSWHIRPKKGIILPKNYTDHLVEPLMLNMVVLAAQFGLPPIVTENEKEIYKVEESISSFYDAFFSEIRLSTTKIVNIAEITNKTTPYQNGVSCARWEIVKYLLNKYKINQKYWKRPHESVCGSTNKKSRKYLSIIANGIVETKCFSKSLQSLITAYIQRFEQSFEERVDMKKFVSSGSDISSLTSRRVKKEIKLSKGKSTTILKVIKPTKPSQLATVLALERASLTELLEGAWTIHNQAIKKFDRMDVKARKYEDLYKDLKRISDEQWSYKDIVLNASKYRITSYIDTKKYTKKTEQLAELRKITSTAVDIMNRENAEDSLILFNTILSKVPVKDSKGFQVTDCKAFVSLTDDLKGKYPITCKLLSAVVQVTSVLLKKEN
jgi:hypothetical protein